MMTKAQSAQNKKQNKKVEKLLKKLNLSEPEYELAIDYLDCRAEECELGKLHHQNLSRLDWEVYDIAVSLFTEFMADQKREQCSRLFRLLFAIGRETCGEMIAIDYFMEADDCAFDQKALAWTAAWSDRWDLSLKEAVEGLVKMADGKPMVFKESIDSLNQYDSQYRIVFMALYFTLQYHEAGQIAPEDEALMEQYEEALLGCLDQWLARKKFAAREKIAVAVRSHQLTAEVLESIKSGHISTEHVKDKSALTFIGGMAYLNFRLSGVLMDMVRVCLALDLVGTLCIFAEISFDWQKDTAAGNMDYDTLFGVEPLMLICWAAAAGNQAVLKRQLDANPEAYVKAVCADAGMFRQFGSEAFFLLLDILQEENPALHRQVMDKMADHGHMIDLIMPDSALYEETLRKCVRSYLWGDDRISVLYPYAGQVCFDTDVHRDIERYQKHCDDKAFLDRWKSCVALCGAQDIVPGNSVEEVEALFRSFEHEGMDVGHQLGIFGAILKEHHALQRGSDEALVTGAENCFARYLDAQPHAEEICRQDGAWGARREETLDAFSKASAEGRYLALRVMRKNAARYKQVILSFAADKTKLVKAELFDILCAQKDWADDIRALLGAEKAAAKELAARVITQWQQEDGSCGEALLQAVAGDRDEKLLEWAYQTPFCAVHKRNGEIADKETIQDILLCYASYSLCGISREALELAKDLEADEFAFYMNELFDKWIAAGAEAKKRWVVYASSIHGGEDIITKLQHQIPEWVKESRGEIAAEAVRALTLNPSPRALLVVDDMSRSIRHRQVRNAAVKALDFAAEQLGINREELADRIVPDLGFNDNLHRTFDYGTRRFQVVLTPALEVEVYDQNGKRLKNLPAPGKTDDQVRAAAAYEEYKRMKKEMKSVVASQRGRLEYALAVGREWSAEAWRKLFVRNPLMHQFAIGLIWGVYEKDQLIQSFRYMEDGSFNTQNEEEYKLPEQASIGLVHPLELSEKLKAVWRQQLADYEIIQPFAQIDRAVYHVAEEEAEQKGLKRYDGCRINAFSLDRKMTELGWRRGPVQEGGWFFAYYREDTSLDMGVEMHFSGRPIEQGNETVRLQEARFYQVGAIERRGSVYDEMDEKRACFLKDVPPRYFSEMVLQLAEVAACE